MSDQLAHTLREWLENYDAEGFGCACAPGVVCGTCQWRERIRPLQAALAAFEAAPQQAQAPERLALDMLCGLAGEVSTDDPMTAAERIFDHVQAERAAHVQELKNYRRNLEGRDALIARWRAGMKEIISQRMGAEAIRERLQSLLQGAKS